MRNRNRKQRPQSHYNTFFDPMVYALDKIKSHFDERAHFAHSKTTGERVIRYAIEDGSRTILGGMNSSRLVNTRVFREFTEDQAKQMAVELGML